MNTRIFSASIFCAALLCPVLSACSVYIPPETRPEIAQRLDEAQRFYWRGNSERAHQLVAAAEAVPNQSDEEKQTVAQVKSSVAGRNIESWDGPQPDDTDDTRNVVSLPDLTAPAIP